MFSFKAYGCSEEVLSFEAGIMYQGWGGLYVFSAKRASQLFEVKFQYLQYMKLRKRNIDLLIQVNFLWENHAHPLTVKKSIATSTGEIGIKSIEIYGQKIPLELRKYLLEKQEKFMCINMPQSSNGRNQRTRHLTIWHDHSTILHTGYILFAVWIIYDPKSIYF